MKLIAGSALCLLGFLSITQARSITTSQHSIPPLPNNAVTHKFSDWLSAFNSADEATIHDFYSTSFNSSITDSESTNSTVFAHLIVEPTQLAWMANWTGGFELADIEPDFEHSDTSITVLLQQKKTHPGYFRAKMVIDDDQPGQPITQLDLYPVATPLKMIPLDHPNRTLYEKGLQPLTPGLRERLIRSIVTVLRGQYIYPQQAEEKIAILEQNFRNGVYDGMTDSDNLYQRLATDIIKLGASGEWIFEKVFINYQEPYELHAKAYLESQLNDEGLIEHHRSIQYGFGNVSFDTESLPGKTVATLPITYLASIEVPGVLEAMGEAMNNITDADVLILDLRHCTGMSADTAAFILSYLFDEQRALTKLIDRNGEVLNSTKTMPIEELKARGIMRDRYFGGSKPVYVLTNNRTMNQAELIAYTVQAYGRGVVIGEQETTLGWAHPMETRVSLLEEEFGAGWWSIWVQTVRVVHEATGKDWENVGVKSDIVVDEMVQEEHCRHKARLAAIEIEKNKVFEVQDELR
ncbi:ClpP/crotonase [Stipitochalara longipes BDJ]|nr:ClpP/crotonase [Stipitochalara longipes BDJ]